MVIQLHLKTLLWTGGLVAAAGVGALALAGDINPPAGPVAPTMKTLDEVYTAAASGSGGGSNAHCIPGLYGALGLFGSCAIPGLPASTPNPSFEVIKFEQNMSKPPPPAGGGGGGVGGPVTISDFILTKPIDRTSIGLYRALTQGTAFSAATITLVDAGGTPTITIALKSCYITSRKAAMVYRCDGSTVMTEEIGIASTQVRYTDAVTGQFWEFDSASGQGSGG